MSDDEARQSVASRWLIKAERALTAARREHAAGDLDLAVNRVYYACFYAASAVLLSMKQSFVSHAGLRSAVHQHLVKPGLLPVELGRFYDQAFDDRQESDYAAVTEHDTGAVERRIKSAERFVAHAQRLLGQR